MYNSFKLMYIWMCMKIFIKIIRHLTIDVLLKFKSPVTKIWEANY